jgi:hypothetical protein
MKTIKLFAGVIAMTLAFAACGGVDSKIADLKAACEAGEGEKATEIAIELAELKAEDEKAISEEQEKEVDEIMKDCDCLDFEKLIKAAMEIEAKK